MDEGRARDGGMSNEREKWRERMHKGKDVGTLEVVSGLGLDRCAVEVLRPRRGERLERGRPDLAGERETRDLIS